MSGQASEVWEAAGVGHRITHEDDLPPPVGVLPIVLKKDHAEAVTKPGMGASLSAKLSKSLASLVMHEMQVEGEPAEDCPDACGVIELGSEDTFLGPDQRMAATANPELDQDCNWHVDGPIIQGAATVFVNRLPWARRNDELDCGARVGEGEPTVFVGGPPTEGKEHTPQIWKPQAVAASNLGASQLLTDASLAAKVSAAMGGGAEPTGPAPSPGGGNGSALGAALTEGTAKYAKFVQGLARGD
jgi:uncharacterized Zn-binding protein involved in type VI secretion